MLMIILKWYSVNFEISHVFSSNLGLFATHKAKFSLTKYEKPKILFEDVIHPGTVLSLSIIYFQFCYI